MTAAHDIFLSYAREDAAAAEAVAAALAREGFSVWWDRRILAGQAFDQRIEGALDAARVVLVLWSPDSVGSEWVKNEAAAGLQAEKLVPAMLAPVTLPLEFRRRQTADLSGWQGEAAHPGWRSLCEALQALQGQKLPVASQPQQVPQAQQVQHVPQAQKAAPDGRLLSSLSAACLAER